MKLSLVLALASVAFAQTTLDLRSQSRNIDFSGAISAKPVPVGATLPATCGTGEVFFLSSAMPGGNLYGCVATNTWVGLGAATVTGADFTDFAASVSDGVFSIESGLVSFVVNGLPVVTTLGSGSISPVSGTDSGTFRIYADYNSGSPVLRCAAGSGVTPGNYTVSGAFAGGTCISAEVFPAFSIPLARVDVYLGTIQAPVDSRALLSRDPVLAGTGLTMSGNTLSVAMSGSGSGGVARALYELLPVCNSAVEDREFVFTNGIGLRAQCDGTNYEWFYQGQKVQLPGSESSFTVVNTSGGQTVSDDAGALYVHGDAGGSGPVTALKSLGGATTITAAVMFGLTGADGNTCGLILTDGTTVSSKVTLFGWRTSGGVARSAVQNYSNYATVAATTELASGGNGVPVWLRVQISSGNHLFSVSVDGGRTWELAASQAAYESATHFGVGCDAGGAMTGAGMMVVSLQAE